MTPAKLLVLFAALGLAVVASPLVGTADAVACRLTDVECQVRYVQHCVLPDPEDPLSPRFCPE